VQAAGVHHEFVCQVHSILHLSPLKQRNAHSAAMLWFKVLRGFIQIGLLTSASACTLHGYGMGMGKNLKKHSNHDLMTSKTTEFEKRIFPRMSSENHTLFTGANLVVRLASGLEVAKTRFQTFLLGNSVLFKWKCQIRELHAHGMERGQVLTRYCG